MNKAPANATEIKGRSLWQDRTLVIGKAIFYKAPIILFNFILIRCIQYSRSDMDRHLTPCPAGSQSTSNKG